MPQAVSALALGTAVAWVTLNLATSQWGQRSTPEVYVPHDGPALGFSYSVNIATPGWVWPVALLAGGCGTLAASVLIERLSLLRGQQGKHSNDRA